LRRAPAFRDLPIIMLSSNARMLDRLQAKGAGATDFMCKPIEADKVLALLNKYLSPNSLAGGSLTQAPIAEQRVAKGTHQLKTALQTLNQNAKPVSPKA
jgi:CheY-like chemotaxis protein